MRHFPDREPTGVTCPPAECRGGHAGGERFEDTIVRIQPTRIISIGIESGEPVTSARSVGTA